MNQYLWLVGVLVAALIGGFIAAVPIAGLALMVSLLVVIPLTLGVAAMFASLCGAWLGNWIGPAETRRHLLRIVAATEIAAGVLAVLLVGLVLWLGSMGVFSPSILVPIFIASVVLLAVAATLATWRFRDNAPNPGRDALVTLGLLGVTGLAIVWGYAFALLLSQVGL